MTTSILFVITDSGIGGSEKVLTDLLIRLDRNRFTPVGVVILKSKREIGSEWEKLGIPVFPLHMKFIPCPWDFWALRKIIRETRPQIVQAFLFHAVQMTRLSRMTDPSFKLVSSPRVNYRFAPSWAKWVDRLLKRFDSAVISESNSTKAFLSLYLGYPGDKIFVAQNGVDSEKFQKRENDRLKIRKELEVNDNEILIGGVGRLHNQKGFADFVNALSIIEKTIYPFKGVIVGEGPERESLENLAKGKKLNLKFLGLRRDMAAIYSGLDIYVQSSLYEGLPNALLEAMASGCAVVSTSVDGVLDIAKTSENCLLIPPGNLQALAGALSKLINDPSLRGRISEGARKTATDFSLENMIKKFEAAYSTLIS